MYRSQTRLCLSCRRVWHAAVDGSRRRSAAACGQCGSPGRVMPAAWRAPKRSDEAAWAHIAAGRIWWDRDAIERGARRDALRTWTAGRSRPRNAARHHLSRLDLPLQIARLTADTAWLTWVPGQACVATSEVREALVQAVFRTPGICRVILFDAPDWVVRHLNDAGADYPRHHLEAATSRNARTRTGSSRA